MGIFTLEHSRLGYFADFALYGSAVVVLAAFLLIAGPAEQRLEIVLFASVGLVGWTAIEYVLHRFVLHGVQRRGLACRADCAKAHLSSP